jgi:hypothetical protein
MHNNMKRACMKLFMPTMPSLLKFYSYEIILF